MKKIIGFGSIHCTACQHMKPILVELAMQGIINIEFNVFEENPEAFNAYDFPRLPALIFTKDGVELQRTFGPLSIEEILEIYNLEV
jgi:thiol-disulfide isomerase/thioredoxin